MNSFGVRSPSDECGRSSLYSLLQTSVRSRASAIDRNQLALSSSSRSRALNDSMKALSVGFPGREKSISTALK